MRVYVEGVGLRGPGLSGWQASRSVLAGDEDHVPTPTVVPPPELLSANERRRAVQTVKLALTVGAEAFTHAQRSSAETATVFASSGGDGNTIHEILTVLASPQPDISPTRFHHSLHNAPAGYWGIATQSHAPTSTICCHDGSFAAGLVEATVYASIDRRAVGLIVYDLPYPEPLNRVRPIAAVFGVALVLAPEKTEAAFARLDIELQGIRNISSMSATTLEELRLGTPAARSLPLLAALARHAPSVLALEYLGGLQVGVSLAPVASDRARPA